MSEGGVLDKNLKNLSCTTPISMRILLEPIQTLAPSGGQTVCVQIDFITVTYSGLRPSRLPYSGYFFYAVV